MEQESVISSEQTATSDSGADTKSEAYQIAMGGTDAVPSEAQNAVDADSLAEAKPEVQAAEVEQKTDETDKETEKKEDAKTEEDAHKVEPEVVVEQTAEELEKQVETDTRKRLNLIPQTPDTLETANEKYKNASREAHRLVDELKAVDTHLSELGVARITKDDGSFGLIATDKYLTEDINVGELVKEAISKLSDEQKLIFDSDETAAKTLGTIASDLANKMMSKRPPVNATSDDARLPAKEVDALYSEMAKTKIGEGDDAEALYPDLDAEDVGKVMYDLFTEPVARDFFIAAHKSKENMQWYIDALHGKVFRARAPMLAKMADARRTKENNKETLKKEASVESDGSAGSGITATSGITPAQEAEAIAKADGSAW